MTKLNGKSVITKLISPVSLIMLGAGARLIPHPANFAPVAAMALFGGAYLSKKQALIIPIMVMVVSDLFIGFDSVPMRIAVYGSFLLTVLIGFWLRKHKNFGSVAIASILASSLFFVLTNLAVWAFSGMYSKTMSGLGECFILAIPFFRNTIAGDFFYTGVFFGGYNLLLNISRPWAWQQRA